MTRPFPLPSRAMVFLPVKQQQMKALLAPALIALAGCMWLCSPSKVMAQGRPIFGGGCRGGVCSSSGFGSSGGYGDYSRARQLAVDPEGFKAAKERNKLKSRIQAEKDVWGMSYTEMCFIRQYGFRPVFD